MQQTPEEKYQRRALRKKINRWKAKGLDTSQLEGAFAYRTTQEFRDATSQGGKKYWDTHDDSRLEFFATPEFRAGAANYAAMGWADPHYQEKRSNALVHFYSIPENRLAHSIRMKEALDTPEFRAKCSQRVGPLSPNWRGGISFEPYCYKFNADFRRNVRHFFNNQCVLCLYEEQETPQQKRLLNVHHVHYDKKSLCNDTSPRMFAPLCDSHHGMTNGDREFWEALLSEIITSVYNGQSYYSEEEWSAIKLRLCLPEVTETSDPQQPIEA